MSAFVLVEDLSQLRNLPPATRLRVAGRLTVASKYDGLVAPGGMPLLEALAILGTVKIEVEVD